MQKVEIRVRPVIRHVVTRYTQDARGGSSEAVGEYANEQYAEHVAHALRYIAAIELPSFDVRYSARYGIGAHVLCVGHKHIVKHVTFTAAKVRYGLAYHGNPDGDVIDYDSDHVYPWHDGTHKTATEGS